MKTPDFKKATAAIQQIVDLNAEITTAGATQDEKIVVMLRALSCSSYSTFEISVMFILAVIMLEKEQAGNELTVRE